MDNEVISNINLRNVCVGDFSYKVNRGEDIKILHNLSDILPVWSEENGLHLNLRGEKAKSGCILPLDKNVILNLAPKYVFDENSYKEVEKMFCENKAPIAERLAKNIFSSIETPTPVQSISIPAMIEGRDVLIQSNSGTGKTIAQVIGSLWHFNPEDITLQHIFITSSHEVASQIYNNVMMLVPGKANVQLCIGQKKETTRGTGGFRSQASEGRPESLRDFCKRISSAQILVCTMGKFYDCLFNKKIIDVSHLKTITIDEFDNIIAPNNYRSDNVQSTANQINNVFTTVPKHTQRAFFSATVENALKTALEYFRQGYGMPLIVLKEQNDVFLEGIRQFYVEVEAISDEIHIKGDILIDLLSNLRIAQCIIFANSIDVVKNIKENIRKLSIPISTEAFHAQLSDQERKTIHKQFIDGSIKILVSTDVLARGFDAHQVNLVINFDMPNSFETYVHRIGRSGRFGRKGTAISFVSIGGGEMEKIDQINSRSPKSQIVTLPDNLSSLL